MRGMVNQKSIYKKVKRIWQHSIIGFNDAFSHIIFPSESDYRMFCHSSCAQQLLWVPNKYEIPGISNNIVWVNKHLFFILHVSTLVKYVVISIIGKYQIIEKRVLTIYCKIRITATLSS